MAEDVNPNEITLDTYVIDEKSNAGYGAEIYWMKDRTKEKDLEGIRKRFLKIGKNAQKRFKNKLELHCFMGEFKSRCYIYDPGVDLTKEDTKEIIKALDKMITKLDPDYVICEDPENEEYDDFRYGGPFKGNIFDITTEAELYRIWWDRGVNKLKILKTLNKFWYVAIRKDRVSKELLKKIKPKKELKNHYIFGKLDPNVEKEVYDLLLMWHRERVNLSQIKTLTYKFISKYSWLEKGLDEWEVSEVQNYYDCYIGFASEKTRYRDVVNLVDVLDEIVDKLDPDYVIYTDWDLFVNSFSDSFYNRRSGSYVLPKKIKDRKTLIKLLGLYTAIRKDRIDEKLKKKLKKAKNGFIINIGPIRLLFEERKNYYVYVSGDLLELRKEGKTKYGLWAY